VTGRLALVGPGRAGRAVSGALAVAGWSAGAVVGRGDDPAAAAGSDLVVVAVPDGAVSAVAEALVPHVGAHTLVVHLSGALGVEALAALAAAPCRVGALHPLQTLAGAPDDAARLRGTWFAVEGDPEVAELARACGGHPFAVGDRARYHATAVVASNHLVALLGQAERLAAGAGVPVAALWPLVERTVENVRERGAAAALTGPVARGDADTVARHLAALPADELATYRALAREALRLSGRYDAELAELLA
jgi:predicted short-subunit dehydrogenase-like oxidoreductase (DUF2520 family)